LQLEQLFKPAIRTDFQGIQHSYHNIVTRYLPTAARSREQVVCKTSEGHLPRGIDSPVDWSTGLLDFRFEITRGSVLGLHKESCRLGITLLTTQQRFADEAVRLFFAEQGFGRRLFPPLLLACHFIKLGQI
jgi:hypothetical protein